MRFKTVGDIVIDFHQLQYITYMPKTEPGIYAANEWRSRMIFHFAGGNKCTVLASKEDFENMVGFFNGPEEKYVINEVE